MCKGYLLIITIVAYAFSALGGSAPKQINVSINSTTQIEKLGGGKYKVVAEVEVATESLITTEQSLEHPKKNSPYGL